MVTRRKLKVVVNLGNPPHSPSYVQMQCLQGERFSGMSPKDSGCGVIAGADLCCSKHDGGEHPGRYCVSNLAIDQYTTLLHSRQSRYGNLCSMSVFLRHHTYVSFLQSFLICSYECKCSADCDTLTKLDGHECRV